MITLKVDNDKPITQDFYNHTISKLQFQYNALNQQTKVITHKGDTLINHYDAEGLTAEIEENKKLTKFIFHITSSTGKVENRYSYDAFGNTLESQETIHNRIQYTGQIDARRRLLGRWPEPACIL